MRSYDFVLRFLLPDDSREPDTLLDCLFEAGCDDATIGVGKPGRIALDFTRQADTAEAAVSSAVAQVRQAVPGAVLLEASPDLVNLADLAELLGCSRQNLRKYATGDIRASQAAFPEPLLSGNPSLWRLAEVAAWLERHAPLRPPEGLAELARVTAQLNLDIQRRRMEAEEAA